MFETSRRPTREVRVGPLIIGGGHPISIQSMTVADTMETGPVVDEIDSLVRAGCPLVRVTVPHVRAAENLPAIRSEMLRRGIDVPLVADIHFTPAAALVAADYVEKVRINPGNYADRKRFAVREYTDAEYAEELHRIREEFAPLVHRLKERGVALRIGTNHGSLSDRILNRFGDTPDGMVESALEFVRICRELDFHEIVLSMKSSVPSVMMAANRLLVRRMSEEGMDYPIHLGVTEAGGGLEGRVKSAVGIGALLLEGIGDTIRVSLTEDSVHEIEACRRILDAVERRSRPRTEPAPSFATPMATEAPPGGAGARRESRRVLFGPVACGGTSPPRVEARLESAPWDPGGPDRTLGEALATLNPQDSATPQLVAEILSLKVPPDGRGGERIAALATFADTLRARAPGHALLLEWDLRAPGEIHALEPFLPWTDAIGARVPHAFGATRERIALLSRLAARHDKPIRFRVDAEDPFIPASPQAREICAICAANGEPPIAFVIEGIGMARAARAIARALDADLVGRGIPLFLDAPGDAIEAAVAVGSALAGGIGDGLCVRGEPARTAYTILQACRLRLTRAEFIACPSCGRTLFDLQATTRRIQQKTAHLAGVKIAVMGCVVNGPGEMADADFGYVGSAPGRIDLYVGRNRVRQAIPEEEADARLVDLIRENGMWVDPQAEAS